MAENEEELKSVLMKMKEESEKAGLKLNIQKLRSWHLVLSLDGKQMGNNGNSERLYFLGVHGDCNHEIKRHLFLGRKAMANLVHFISVTQSCRTLCDPMDCSAPGLPVHHQLPELTQTHVH